MNNLETDSHTLLLDKAPCSLKEQDILDLQRIESLDVSGYSEADVREEVINTILRILGYQKGKDYSVDREKNIKFLDGKNKRIDYNLTLWKRNFWLIEAKKPINKKDRFGYNELRQAVEYATHPNIDAVLIVLCDGLKIEVFDREQSLEKPILWMSLSNITKDFYKLQQLLGPLQVWFFYRRRVIRAIDRAFDNEGNQYRVKEFKQIVESRLQEKRSQILDNFKKMKKDDEDAYRDHLSGASCGELIDVHFFSNHNWACITAMINNLLTICKKQGCFRVLYRVFPDNPRDTNDHFYMNALELLINVDKAALNVGWLPEWLSNDDRSDTHYAIQRLINLCLNYFDTDLARKSILLASNTIRRLIMYFAVVFPDLKQIAELEHKYTRFGAPEFCWEQILSSRKRNVLLGIDRLSMFSTAKFVNDYSEERHGFNAHTAMQALQALWRFEEETLRAVPNYLQLLEEYDFGEIFPTEALGVVYDKLGHACLCVVSNHEVWKKYVLDKHIGEVETLADIGSWAAQKLLGEDIDKRSTRKIDKQVLANRFFFGDSEILKKLAKLYGHQLD